MQVNHKDFDKKNNRIDNLELVDNSGNQIHSYTRDRARPWAFATMWKDKPRITPLQEAQIQDMRRRGVLLKDIAVAFNLGITHTHRIIKKGG